MCSSPSVDVEKHTQCNVKGKERVENKDDDSETACMPICVCVCVLAHTEKNVM
jgi:hypothetical protein